MNIAIVGSPGSGKTTLAAMLYSACLLAGIKGARLILEEAPRYIGEKGKLDTLVDQMQVWENQKRDCEVVASGGFNPLILDGALWLSSIYVRYSMAEKVFPKYFAFGKLLQHAYDHTAESEKHFQDYDLTIYIPFDVMGKAVEIGEHRIHDTDQSFIIDQYIGKGLEYITGQLMVCPVEYGRREQFIEEVVEYIKLWK